MPPSRCPPWQPERPGPTRREPRRAQRSYTTRWDTIDACVVLDRDAFLARVCDALRPPAGNKVFAHGPVHYIDPIGAYSQPRRPPQVHISYVPQAEDRAQRYQPFGPDGELARAPDVHFSKTFRYAYQSEYRFVSFPAQPTDRLSAPLTFNLGPLADIGRLIVL